jgi:hypothetical protein
MLSFLDASPKPICDELSQAELIVAIDSRHSGGPRRLLRSAVDGRTLSRWTLTAAQRAAIAAGADVFVEIESGGRVFPVVKVAISESIEGAELARDYGIVLERKASA